VNKIVCFVGPSGVGKTSYIKRLVRAFGFQVPAVVTTRKSRVDDGQNYIYLSKSEFLRMISEKKFIEHDSYNGYYYGTIKDTVMEIFHSSKACGCVLDLTPEGCRQVKAVIPEAIIISLLPDDVGWLKKRLFERGFDSSKAIRQRTKILESFIEDVKNLDSRIIYCNYNPESWDSTFSEIVSIINPELV